MNRPISGVSVALICKKLMPNLKVASMDRSRPGETRGEKKKKEANEIEQTEKRVGVKDEEEKKQWFPGRRGGGSLFPQNVSTAKYVLRRATFLLSNGLFVENLTGTFILTDANNVM